jgi:hypothetical protein
MSDNILLNVCEVAPIPGAVTAYVVAMECNGYSVWLARRNSNGDWWHPASGEAVALLADEAAATERAHERAQWEVG